MLVPELSLADPMGGTACLQRVFGFEQREGLLHFGSQPLIVVQADGEQTHGRIDHLALSVPDIDAALDRMIGNGAALAADVTPNGPAEIGEFWGAGIRYVYLDGPEGARIELCQRNSGPLPGIGHDHIGIPCSDIAAMQAFFATQGATPIASVDLVRDGGTIPVRFLAFAGGVIELYAPPAADRLAGGLWSRLRVQGIGSDVAGPEGLILAPL